MNEHTADVLGAVRAATASRHAVLDRAMPLARPAPGLEDYEEHLRLLRRWLAGIAQASALHGDGPQDARLLPPVERLHLIDADLAEPCLSGGAGAPGGPGALADGGAAWRWGVAYVVEGSQLGGTVLYRRLAERLAPHPLRYLHGGAPPGPRWQRFLAALRAEVTSGPDIAQACAGACAAFDALIAMLPSQPARAEAA